jgi:hypothetical protein
MDDGAAIRIGWRTGSGIFARSVRNSRDAGADPGFATVK